MTPAIPTLVGGVGYSDLRDFSVGLAVLELLRTQDWPPHVRLENLSYNPVSVIHRLQEAEPPFERLVLVGAVERGRPPGSVVAYRWDRGLPDCEAVQDRVAEAVTGVISLENLAIVVVAFDAAPDEVCLVEIEPQTEGLGTDLSEAVSVAVGETIDLVRRIALAPGGEASVPQGPLGGGATSNGRPPRPSPASPYHGRR